MDLREDVELNPFTYLDRFYWNPFAYTRYTRYAVATVVLAATIIWAAQGFDSGVKEYGTSLHWSVFTIYGAAFIALNKHHEYNGIKGTRNFTYSCSATILSLALFEWYWMAGYYFIHGEHWILSLQNPTLTQNAILTIIGAGWATEARLNGYRLNLTPFTATLIIVFMSAPLYWLYIGFPQTCYPQPDGSITYIENNYVHLWNLIAKAGLTAAAVTPFTYDAVKKLK